MKRGWVYLIAEWNNIEPDKNPVKIGVTTGDIEKRLKKLQTGNASELIIVGKFRSEMPFRLEKMLHVIYINKRRIGEWFILTDEEVINFSKLCKEKEEILKSLDEFPVF